MEVQFGSTLVQCTSPEHEHIPEDDLEEGLRKSALKETVHNANAVTHPIEKATTNVVCIKFSGIEDNQALATGDPVSCNTCKGILNYKSVVTNSGNTWQCEFCGNQNQLQASVDANEIPTGPITEYLLEPPKAKNDEQAILFCLDTSGSMGGSRIKALQQSLDQQLVQLSQTAPNSRVGLILFNSEVTFFNGIDGSREIIVPSGDRALNESEAMKEVARECKALGKISDTIDTLRGRVRRLKQSGSTALGPALLLGVHVASALGAGSQVVSCTDGEANIGMGASNPAFYATLAGIAKTNGVSVSIMSFQDTDVSLEQLAVLADQTGGKITISDLGKLSKNFGNAVADTVVAWGVEVTRVASQSVKINQADQKINLGNCVKNSEFTAEFEATPNHADQEVIFQTQVRYTRITDGARMLKVFTNVLPATQSRADAEAHADLAVLALHAVRSSATRAQEGVYTHARLSVYAHQRLLLRVAQARGKLLDYLRFLEDLEIIDGELRYSERQEEKRGLRDRGDRDRDRDRARRDDRRGNRDDRGANVFYQMKSWNTRNMRRERSRSPPRQRHRSRSRSPVRSRSPARSRSPVRNTSVRSRSPSPARNTLARSRSRSPPARNRRSRSPPMRNNKRSRSPPRSDRRDRDRMDDRRDRDRDRKRK